MRIIELFAGIGACSTALKRIGIDLEIVDAVEIDKYAIASFNAIHGTNFETQDITTWNKDLKDIDLITHGSPCQDFSVAGKQAGGDIDSGTRSSLMYETIRIVGKIRPKYVLWENVKNILSKKHRHNFDNYLEKMKELGYTNYYQVLNAKDYGIPQNRERVYTISIRKDVLVYDDYNSKIRKDQETIGTLTTNCGSSSKRNGWKIIEANENFTFPEKEELKLRLKDMLEDEVDEKYYLSNKMIDYILKPGTKNYKKEPELNNEIAKPLLATMTKMHRAGIDNYIAEPKCVQVGNLQGGKWDKINESCRRVYGEEGISPTIHTCQGGNTEPKIMTLGNYMPSNHNASRIVDNNGLAPTVKENHGTVTATNINYRIRKLTPKECWRLMGFDDEDFEKAQNIPTSNTQLYKQAGNSIVVNVLEKIFKNLFNI